jgi:hypothetical protein
MKFWNTYWSWLTYATLLIHCTIQTIYSKILLIRLEQDQTDAKLSNILDISGGTYSDLIS